MEEEKQPFKNHLPGCYCILCNSYRKIFNLDTFSDFLDFERLNIANLKRNNVAGVDKIKLTYNKRFEYYIRTIK